MILSTQGVDSETSFIVGVSSTGSRVVEAAADSMTSVFVVSHLDGSSSNHRFDRYRSLLGGILRTFLFNVLHHKGSRK